MRSSPSTLCLLSLACMVAGCSQTRPFRSGNTSDMRTVASVGDRPLPIVAGEPGIVSGSCEPEELDRPAPTGSSESQAGFMTNAASPCPMPRSDSPSGGTKGGKAVVAITDRSVPSRCTASIPARRIPLIAEFEDEDGAMAGRAQVKAPQTDVRIALEPRDGSANQGHASIRPARSRVKPISSIDAIDDEPSDEAGEGSDRRINTEDLEPPAAEAAALLSRNTVTRRGAAPPAVPQSPASRRLERPPAGSRNSAGASTGSRAGDDGDEQRGDDPAQSIGAAKATMMGRIHCLRRSSRARRQHSPSQGARGRESRQDGTNRAGSTRPGRSPRRPEPR